jgi:Leucine-rich repeat (LRR) protein
VDLLNRAEQRTNCLGERELVLNGYGIPAIENTAALVSSSATNNNNYSGGGGEEFDTLNICNNLIIRLDNFSRWHRLSNLIASNNRIESIDGNNFIKNIPNLTSLTLSYNNISSLSVVQTIGQSCKSLQFLDLTGNSVTSKYSSILEGGQLFIV